MIIGCLSFCSHHISVVMLVPTAYTEKIDLISKQYPINDHVWVRLLALVWIVYKRSCLL